MTENRQKLAASGIRPRYFWTPIWVHIFVMFFGGVVIGPFYLLYFGIRNLLRKQTKFYRIKTTQLYVPDKRFKTGKRPEGVKMEKLKSDITLPATDQERKVYLVKGISNLVLSGVLILGLYYFYEAYYTEDLPAVVSAESGLRLRSKPSIESATLNVLPEGSRLVVMDSVNDWYEVDMDSISGWVNKEHVVLIKDSIH